MSTDSNQKIDYLYKEYTRLSEKCDELIKSTFDDFKLFGAAGAVIVIWKPISDLIAPINSKLDSSSILFLGFLSILAVIDIIGYLFLIKQAYGWYFVYNLQAYEIEIKKFLGEAEDSQLFNFNMGKSEQRFITGVYKTSFRSLLIVFFIVGTLLPFIALCYSKMLYAVIYLLLSLISSITYYQLFRRMMKQFSDKSYL
ncbi:hypothetical protein C7B65_15650 [Phormidesmis priestleyi ULC007]|uniref:Uncharacterized protein n=1 Tax=Phormidesmis priestleyi ULC007 TaxID=1920490 RepID=A0A2T1DD18_9CYAN|nr:hypothetical protein [Phormidesmis priestleyi]PSB18331.1 hypothetical protein C7B65_15650 [Phormidesmis priestleyi ULC007]PZO46589.1 MAG: hypothetical protein DCF14_22410 [Phormidesmis priestleyi]